MFKAFFKCLVLLRQGSVRMNSETLIGRPVCVGGLHCRVIRRTFQEILRFWYLYVFIWGFSVSPETNLSIPCFGVLYLGCGSPGSLSGKRSWEELSSFRRQTFMKHTTFNPEPHPYFPLFLVFQSLEPPWYISPEGRTFFPWRSQGDVGPEL